MVKPHYQCNLCRQDFTDRLDKLVGLNIGLNKISFVKPEDAQVHVCESDIHAFAIATRSFEAKAPAPEPLHRQLNKVACAEQPREMYHAQLGNIVFTKDE